MFTIALTVIATILLAGFMGKRNYSQFQFGYKLLKEVKDRAVETLVSGSTQVYIVPRDVLVQFGGGCSFSRKAVAIEEGSPACVLEHELRHANRGHNVVKLFLLVLGTAVIVALPAMIYNNIIAGVGVYLVYAVMQLGGDLLLEMDADQVTDKKMMAHFLEQKREEYKNLKLPKIMSWLVLGQLDARIKALT